MNSPGGIFYRRDPATGALLRATIRGAADRDQEKQALEMRTPALLEALERGKHVLESEEGDQWIPRRDEEARHAVAGQAFPLGDRLEVLSVKDADAAAQADSIPPRSPSRCWASGARLSVTP